MYAFQSYFYVFYFTFSFHIFYFSSLDYAMCPHSEAFSENIKFVKIASFLAGSLMSLEKKNFFVLNFTFLKSLRYKNYM